MSEELVNKITLNFLISKQQLQKLNKKIQENEENNRKSDKEIYENRIKELFLDLLVNHPPEDLLQEVKTGFDYFLDKCIYYFKIHDNNLSIENERNETVQENENIEEEQENNEEENNEEENNQEDYDNNEQEEEENEEEEEEEEIKISKKYEPGQTRGTMVNNDTVSVFKKYNKSNTLKTQGVDDIQKLPLDWFQHVRTNYEKNKIIPRKKEVLIGPEGFKDKKNINK